MGNMRYNYTAYYKTEEERIDAIAEDILRDYPGLGDLAREAAAMETPFGRVHEDYDQFSYQENCVNRLINIVIVTEGKAEFKTEFDKACRDLLESYRSWKYNFTYANPEEQEPYLIMDFFLKHQKDPSIPLVTYRQAGEIIRKKLEEEELKRQWVRDHTMQYHYTAYYETDEERIEAIAADILREYPALGELAREAAAMETPFGRVHEDYDQFSSQENHINRLINIVILTEGKPEFQAEYTKALKDLLENYRSWSYNFTYANPEEQSVYLLVEVLNKHQQDPSVPLITLKQACAIQDERRRERDRKRKADIFRSQYPGLGPIADEVIRIEEEGNYWIRFVENDIIRLVLVIQLIEGKEEYAELYTQILAELNSKYANWVEYETRYHMSSDQHLVATMMESFTAHLEDSNVPIVTFGELKKEQEKKRQLY